MGASERVALRAGGPADYRAFARVASLGAHRASNGAVALRLDFNAAKKVFLARAPTVFLLRVYGLGACRASAAFQLQGGSCASSKTRPFPAGDLVRPWRGDTIPGAEFCRQA